MQHSLSAGSGYTMSLEKLPGDSLADIVEEDKRNYTDAIAYYRDEKAGKESLSRPEIRVSLGGWCICTVGKGALNGR